MAITAAAQTAIGGTLATDNKKTEAITMQRTNQPLETFVETKTNPGITQPNTIGHVSFLQTMQPTPVFAEVSKQTIGFQTFPVPAEVSKVTIGSETIKPEVQKQTEFKEASHSVENFITRDFLPIVTTNEPRPVPTIKSTAENFFGATKKVAVIPEITTIAFNANRVIKNSVVSASASASASKKTGRASNTEENYEKIKDRLQKTTENLSKLSRTEVINSFFDSSKSPKASLSNQVIQTLLKKSETKGNSFTDEKSLMDVKGFKDNFGTLLNAGTYRSEIERYMTQYGLNPYQV